MQRVYTQGSFDILHRGHIKFLWRCAQLGEVTVSLLSDGAYERYRGYAPAMSYEDRRSVLESLVYVNEVIECQSPSEHTRLQMQNIEPDIAAIGSDWAEKDLYRQWGVSQEWLDRHGILLVYLPYTPGIASSQIKAKLTGQPVASGGFNPGGVVVDGVMPFKELGGRSI